VYAPNYLNTMKGPIVWQSPILTSPTGPHNVGSTHIHGQLHLKQQYESTYHYSSSVLDLSEWELITLFTKNRGYGTLEFSFCPHLAAPFRVKKKRSFAMQCFYISLLRVDVLLC
ncbi:hypothetical protein ACJX0J_029205, partial [Zea mays]